MKYTTDIRKFHKRRKERLQRRGIRFDYSRPSEDYDWITINGVHTPIDDSGNISGGAGGKFNGKKYTGSKMTRSKKRQEKVGSASSKKISIKDIKGKGMAKKVQAYMDAHNGEMPDKETMHEYAYSEHRKALKTLEKAREEYADKYWGGENYIERIASLQENLKYAQTSVENWEAQVKNARTEADKKGAEEDLAYYRNKVENINKTIEELKNKPDYAEHERDYQRIVECAENVKKAKEDNKLFLYNKGDAFKSTDEVKAYAEATGWISEVSAKDILSRKDTNVHIDGMSIKFAVPFANALDAFSNSFPKMTDVCSGIYTDFLDSGVVGYYSDDKHSIAFGMNYVSKKDYVKGKAEYRNMMNNGHFPKGTDLGSSAYHELTHAMENRMKRDDKKNVLDGKEPSTIVLERVQERLNDYDIFFKRKVSIYADRQYPGVPEWKDVEFLAEAMCEAYTSKTPREIAVAVREEFTKLYHEVYD